MQTVDYVIAGLGVAAIAATVLGLVFYDDLAAETQLTFVIEPVDLEAQTLSVSATPTEFQFQAPNNATGAEIVIELAASGTVLAGGDATVSVDLIGPDGTVAASEIFTHTIGPGAQTSSSVFDLSGSWLATPDDVEGNPETYDGSTVWNANFTVVVTVTPPGSPTAGTAFQFTANVGGSALVYHHTQVLPEAQSA